MRFAGAVGFLLGIAGIAFGSSAYAGSCGGEIACGCGDTVRGEAVLEADLENCHDDGLRLVADAVLDCGGHRISGQGAGEGILLDGAIGAEVRDCAITDFGIGVRIRGGAENRIVGSSIRNSKRYGIDLAKGSSRNVLLVNHIEDSGDEGIHVGADANENAIIGNEIEGSGDENLYVLSSRGGVYAANMLSGSGSAAIYAKHVSESLFLANEVEDKTIHVRGHSVDNVFQYNRLEKGRFIFEAYLEREHPRAVEGWTRPTRNRVFGGAVLDTKTCFQFKGALDNSAHQVGATRCKAKKESKKGGTRAAGNVVSLIEWPESEIGDAT